MASARIARDNAPTAMESKSDTSRSKLESEVAIHELRLKELKEIINSIPNEKQTAGKVDLWSFVEVKLPSANLQLILVTEGLGGTKIGFMQCISDKSPIGSALMGKKEGEEFVFNETSGQLSVVFFF